LVFEPIPAPTISTLTQKHSEALSQVSNSRAKTKIPLLYFLFYFLGKYRCSIVREGLCSHRAEAQLAEGGSANAVVIVRYEWTV
jgi:hypothetical protein